jgi:hypothetical protein
MFLIIVHQIHPTGDKTIVYTDRRTTDIAVNDIIK